MQQNYHLIVTRLEERVLDVVIKNIDPVTTQRCVPEIEILINA